MELTSRKVLRHAGAAAFVLAAPTVQAQVSFRRGLTPVFLDNDAAIIEQLRATLSDALGGPIELVQRRTYQEVTGLLLEGSVDAAWLCGYPFWLALRRSINSHTQCSLPSQRMARAARRVGLERAVRMFCIGRTYAH